MKHQIEAYIDLLFEDAEKTEAVQEYRQSLTLKADAAYEQAQAQGQSKETAYGYALQALGDLGAIRQKIQQKEQEKDTTFLPDELLERFIHHSSRESKRIGFGVMLIILGVSIMISLTRFAWFDQYIILGLLPLFLAVVIAVAGFIYSGFKSEAINEEIKDYQLSKEQKDTVKQKLADKRQHFVVKTIVGVSLCILSPLILIGFATVDDTWALTGTSLLLLFVAIAVYLFITAAKQKEDLESLLNEGGLRKKEEKNEKEHQLAAIVWPLAVAVFLVTGFLYELWYINWLIFPLTALIMTSIENTHRLFKK
ncbi:hypothetical protein DES38_101288 [Streptohalobacillus salinus]|uniref:Uncharacterized protein n=1 Tax=Streptohalobacillus salinus TaxID=621096 RepID=A0A2V3WVT4_9BACI|nr:hypothetical protein [Streptohalobacillus salinus]PXW93202.1 hypothetical protein DES38_101288 [Streptohalobacillus salinus]